MGSVGLGDQCRVCGGQVPAHVQPSLLFLKGQERVPSKPVRIKRFQFLKTYIQVSRKLYS